MKNSLLSLCILAFSIFLFSCSNAENKTEKENTENVETEDAEETSSVTDDWIDFEDEDGRFQIKMPGEPTRSSEVEPTDVGNIKMEIFLYEESVTKAYVVGYNDFPSVIFEDADEEDYENMLMGGVNGFTSDIGLDLIEEIKDVTLDNGAKGKMVKARSNINSYHVHYKVFIHKNRLYQVGVMRDGSYPNDEQSKAFFDSFKILD